MIGGGSVGRWVGGSVGRWVAGADGRVGWVCDKKSSNGMDAAELLDLLPTLAMKQNQPRSKFDST